MAESTLFAVALPVPSLANGLRIDATGGGELFIGMAEAQHWAGLYDEFGDKLYTTIWGYGQTDAAGNFLSGPTWPGPTILAKENNPLNVTFYNLLPEDGYEGGHLLPFDSTYHTIHEAVHDLSLLPTNVHLHGGHTDADSDGFAEEVYFQGEIWTNYYDNSQQSGTLWYHPHTLGRTRLDVYAGLAGFYFLRDDRENQLIDWGELPSGDYEIELAFQDRSFTDDGQLYLPASEEEFYDEGELDELRAMLSDFLDSQGLLPEEGLAPAPELTGLPEFFGDHLLTNGVISPHLEVEETQYRFRLLNGNDSRALVFELQDEVDGEAGSDRFSFYQVGTDVGLLAYPVELDRLVLMPGERADIVVDFKALMAEDAARDGVADTQFYWRNFGPDDPFGGFADNTAAIATPDGFQNAELVDPADPNSTGQAMRFDVIPGDAPQSNFSPNRDLNQTLDDLFNTVLDEDNATYTRRLGLFEGLDEYGRLQPMLGSVEPILNAAGEVVNGSSTWSDPDTEVIQLDENGEATEVWEIWNMTGDAHPVHLHLTSFKVLDRTPFTLSEEPAMKPQELHNGEYGAGFTFDAPAGSGRLYGTIDDYATKGTSYGPQANEVGLKDTVIALPGQVTRIVAYFDKPGTYVWHCHILSHEDHDMMRTFTVVPFGEDRPVPGKVIQGTNGSDRGSDRLRGTNQDDIIVGYGGNDIMEGEGGSDIFKLLSLGDGRDTIDDFELGIDKIDISGVLQEIGYTGSDPIADGVLGADPYRNQKNSILEFYDNGNRIGRLAVVEDVKVADLLVADNFIFS